MPQQLITIAQIGCGYWGPNLLRSFSAAPQCRVKYVAESSTERRAYVTQNFPATQAISESSQALDDPEVDAVVVATPAQSHAQLAKAALSRNKHVLVEKPLALTVADADELRALANERSRVLMVGHTFLYTPALRHLKRLIDAHELGDICYFYSQRLNLGQVRSDVNAWWNLAPHDVSMLLYLMNGQMPDRFTATGQDFLQTGIEDVVFATLKWPNNVTALVHVSWLDPNKVRRLTVVGTRKMAVYDDVAENKIAIYDRGFEQLPLIGERMDYDRPISGLKMRSGDILLPKISNGEPLAIEAEHFLDCIRSGKTPLSDGRNGCDVVTVLEKCHSNMRDLETA
jgi:predicted dehydrogenase